MVAGNHLDVAAFAPVAPARTAPGHKFLAPERKTAVPAVAGLHGDNNFINKHRATSIFRDRKMKKAATKAAKAAFKEKN
jgi:hypothetical protein